MHHVNERRNSNWSINEVIKMSGNFIKVSCKDCGSESVIFSRATTVIACSVCGATLTSPSGGKAKLVGCRMVEAVE